ncbi:MAG: hypothetical protein ACI86X_002091 [Moritella sp.]|jgi:hypothetical protein
MWKLSASRFFVYKAAKIRQMIKYIKYIKYITVLILATFVGDLLYEPTVNPILGRWTASEPVYGKYERLIFTEFGLFKAGSNIPADYVIDRNKVTVTVNAISKEYFFVNENLMKQRVPRKTWRYFSRSAENLTPIPVVEIAGPVEQGNISRYKSQLSASELH